MQTRRKFLYMSGAASAATLLPMPVGATTRLGESFAGGAIIVFPIAHASFVMTTPAGTIYADPVGNPSDYAGLPPADMILVTHEHGDHFNAGTLAALSTEATQLITNPAVYAMLPGDLQAQASEIGNGGSIAGARPLTPFQPIT